MSSKKEEERNEKIIRGLLKLPPNRKCINCNSLGPQYVCTNFWTFVCVTCSGIHREFTHRVKSVSMSKFTTQEVEALQRGGNQRAREIFLKDWDPQQMRLPDIRDINKIREFIQNIYVDRKYAGGKYSEKPPRDVQSQKSHEIEHRRASSYHSYSQSPPYENQYEERRYGKQTGMLSRKPGSDRGHYEGKISSFMYSPGSQQEQHTYDDTGSRISDYSTSSAGDPSRFDIQSPNFQDTVYSNPPSQQVRDILIDTARPQTLSMHSDGNIKKELNGMLPPQRTASLESFGSLDTISVKSANSSSLIDIMLEPECAPQTQQNGKFASPLTKLPAATQVKDQDLFNLPVVQQPVISSGSSIDLFAALNSQNSSIPVENKASFASVSENVGWATFDLPQADQGSDVNKGFSSVFPSNLKAHENTDLFSLISNNPQSFSLSATHGPLPSMADQWHVGSHDVKGSVSTNNSESWNAFDDTSGRVPQNMFGTDLHSFGSEPHVMVNKPPITSDPFGNYRAPEVHTKDGYHSSYPDEFASFSVPFDGAIESFPSSMLPLTGETTQQQKSTNPFDLPFDSNLEADNMFMDMSSLREALPGGQLPDTYIDSLAQAWFPQNSAATYVTSLPQGGLSYIAGQVPSSQMSNITSQNPVASLGGNPFA